MTRLEEEIQFYSILVHIYPATLGYLFGNLPLFNITHYISMFEVIFGIGYINSITRKHSAVQQTWEKVTTQSR